MKLFTYSPSNKGFYQIVLCVLVYFATSFAQLKASGHVDADSSWLDEINWHGFLSQNFVLTDENRYMGSSEDGSFKSNEAGLSASLKPYDNLHFSVQGIYKQIGNAEPKGLRLDYAILDWRIHDSFSEGMGVRAGRLKNPYGFFNETRDVAATNISILLPESIYIDYLSSFFHSSDAIAFDARHEGANGTFSYNFHYGRPILNQQTVASLIGETNASSGTMNNARGGFIRAAYEDASGLWRAMLSYVRFRSVYNESDSDPFYLDTGKLTIEQLMLSLEFNWQEWQVISEIQRRNIHAEDFFVPDPDAMSKGLGYYLQLGYSPDPAWKIYLRRDEIFRFKDDRHGSEYIQSARLLKPDANAHSAFAKDTTLGFRYSPSFEWSFAMEVHNIDGTYWLPNIENKNKADHERYWNMLLAQVAYRF